MSDTTREFDVDEDDRMSEQEALMWNVEKDPWLNPNGGAMTIYDKPIDVEQFRRKMRHAITQVPRFYQRVVPGLGRLATPAWVPDPEFDLDYHVRVLHLPAPGTERQLLDLAAQLYVEPLDRTRPLWRMILIEGLEGGGGAMYTLMHHAISDGIGQLRIAEMFQELVPDAEWAPEVDLEGVIQAAVEAHQAKQSGGDLARGLGQTALDSLSHLARRQAGIARRVAAEVAMWPADPKRITDGIESAGTTVKGIADMLGSGDAEEGAVVGAPLWQNRSRHRHLESVRVGLDDLKAAAKAEGATINEAFLAVMANAAVTYHADRGSTFDVLNASFVVSTREDNKAGGNAFTPVPVRLPAAPMSVRERIAAIRDVMVTAREAARSTGGITAFAGVVNLLPTSVVTQTVRSQAKHIDIATSNLRGAPIPLYVSGAKAERLVTMGPLAGTPCNATAVSYMGFFDVGIFIDPVAIEEPEAFRDCVIDAFAELTG
ncbi:MAG: wax ester/triacylglycerol synthase family O-acyltransferase [Acidimicrobiales bacterium]|nr:wax ester/triacylglycerol synthase family O-acyltransferase [Acidimicrobiales bacterium]